MAVYRAVDMNNMTTRLFNNRDRLMVEPPIKKTIGRTLDKICYINYSFYDKRRLSNVIGVGVSSEYL